MKVMINEETKMASVVLPPGTTIKINGIPLNLVSEATVETHKNNVPLIEKPYDRVQGEYRHQSSTPDNGGEGAPSGH